MLLKIHFQATPVLHVQLYSHTPFKELCSLLHSPRSPIKTCIKQRFSYSPQDDVLEVITSNSQAAFTPCGGESRQPVYMAVAGGPVCGPGPGLAHLPPLRR